MSKIKILPEHIQNQIAAGEVVERPASVVKELVENAIDAGATRVEVVIEQGGIEYMAVSDNGCGMSRDDAKLSLTRHATSKIDSLEDLLEIGTFGFRGEALASISSVSDFTLQTKSENENIGTKITANNGIIEDPQDVGCNSGTVIEIKKIFHNIPARRKYLKSPQTEYSYVLEKIQNLILINTDIAFKFVHNGKVIFDVPELNYDDFYDSLENRISRIFGREVQQNTYKVSFEKPELIIRGFVGAPLLARSNKKQQYLFVNKREIKDKLISAAVQEAFKSLLPHGKFPVYFLDVEITSDLVDINVHPRKQEVRFLRSQEVYQSVFHAIEAAVKSEKSVDPLKNSIFHAQSLSKNGVDTLQNSHSTYSKPSFSRAHVSDVKSAYSTGGQSGGKFIPKHEKPGRREVDNALSFTQALFDSPANTQDEDLKNVGEQVEAFSAEKDYRIIGQLKNSYILIETSAGLQIMDQHAAHERIRYEMLIKNMKNQERRSQKVLIPEEMFLSQLEIQVLIEHSEFLESIGFEFDIQGSVCKIMAVPHVLTDQNVVEMVKGMIDNLQEVKVQITENIDAAQERMLTYLSCRKSIMFGDKLTPMEMERLYVDWNACDKKQTCPHGREICFSLTLEEIEKRVCR